MFSKNLFTNATDQHNHDRSLFLCRHRQLPSRHAKQQGRGGRLVGCRVLDSRNASWETSSLGFVPQKICSPSRRNGRLTMEKRPVGPLRVVLIYCTNPLGFFPPLVLACLIFIF